MATLFPFLLQIMRQEEGEGEGAREAEGEAEAEAEAEAREWYVRLENLYLNDSCVGYKRIITIHSSGSALVDRILLYYGLPFSLRNRIRVWASPFRIRRLDRLPVIPKEEQFVSVEFR